MRIVIDSNIVIAAMIKESTTRKILLNSFFEFIGPDYLLLEVRKYKDRIIEAVDIGENEFEILLSLIFSNITLIPEEEYCELFNSLESKDFKDLPYIAVCIKMKAEGIWSHDPHFLEQEKIKVFTNINLLGFIRERD